MYTSCTPYTQLYTAYTSIILLALAAEFAGYTAGYTVGYTAGCSAGSCDLLHFIIFSAPL